MKLINLAVAIFLSFLVFSSNVFAESTTLSNQTIQGSWKLEYTKKSLDTDITTKREDTWEFKINGTMTIKHIPREGGYYDQLPVKYEIEGDKLKIAILGRMGRFDNFTLISIDGNKMLLKARFGDIYQFIKK